MVKKPSVFLMDEPLSNLDAKLRTQIRTDLIELYQKLRTTFVYVTHDQVEAMSMGTDIVLLDQGRILQQASPQAIYSDPENLFTARFIGAPPMNTVDVSAARSSLLKAPEKALHVGFRPERTVIAGEHAHTPEHHLRLSGQVLTREMLGDQVLYKVETKYGIVHVKNFSVHTQDYKNATVLVGEDDLYYFDAREGRLRGEGYLA